MSPHPYKYSTIRLYLLNLVTVQSWILRTWTGELTLDNSIPLGTLTLFNFPQVHFLANFTVNNLNPLRTQSFFLCTLSTLLLMSIENQWSRHFGIYYGQLSQVKNLFSREFSVTSVNQILKILSKDCWQLIHWLVISFFFLQCHQLYIH